MRDFPVDESFVSSANAAQLHDEARGSLVKWPASFTYVNGAWVYRVERDDVDAAKVAAAISNHTPDPNYGLPAEVLTLRQLAAKSSLTAADVAAGIKALIKALRP